MSLTRSAIEKNRVTTVLLLVLLMAGLNAWFSMPQSEDPGFTIRIAMVITYFPGASPERVEQLVTDNASRIPAILIATVLICVPVCRAEPLLLRRRRVTVAELSLPFCWL